MNTAINDSVSRAGYRTEVSENGLTIRRKFRIPLFVWAYLVLYGLYLISFTPNPTNLTVGLSIVVIGILIYYHNSVSFMNIDLKASTLRYKKGLFQVNQYKNLSDVRYLELRTYDVPASASPFKKGNREYIAEIRFVLDKGLPIDLFTFEKYSKEELNFVPELFDKIIKLTGLESKITQN